MVQNNTRSILALYVKVDSVPALFFRRGDRVAFAWGYNPSEVDEIPSEDHRKWDKGVIWCEDMDSALGVWQQFRALRRESAITVRGGAAL